MRIVGHSGTQYLREHAKLFNLLYVLFFYFTLFLFHFIFLTALGLRCCAWAFPSCGEQGLLFIAVRGLLIAVASLVVKPGL